MLNDTNIRANDKNDKFAKTNMDIITTQVYLFSNVISYEHGRHLTYVFVIIRSYVKSGRNGLYRLAKNVLSVIYMSSLSTKCSFYGITYI